MPTRPAPKAYISQSPHSSLHEVFKSDATDVILQHSLKIKYLRVAKWWQNGKIGLYFTYKTAFFARKAYFIAQ